MAVTLGSPRLHLREVGSTSDRARELAVAGAPHGTIVTADVQTAGRGRQGRAWTTPPGGALAVSLVVRGAPELLPLRAGVAVAQAIGDDARLKWPNDVLVGGRKVAGILAEARGGEDWAILGIGVNVALDATQLPPEVRETAGTLGRAPHDVEPFLAALLLALQQALALDVPAVLDAFARHDALRGREIGWGDGETGRAAGLDDEGRLVVETSTGERIALNAGEVHLHRATRSD
jgi:BirA family transcriptional regulator, biotin operon repressor / biotin---[acetyl-CoA-carboxylase] ligase